MLRDLLLGRSHGAVPSPGLIIRGAVLTGTLDLSGVACDVGLFLQDCEVHEPILLSHARLPRVVLTGSRLAGLEANDARIDGGLDARMIHCTGPVNLNGARIGGQTTFSGARIQLDAGSALLADDLRAGGDVVLRDGFHATGTDGVVRLVGADIKGNLDLCRARIDSTDGAALYAERADVQGNLLLRWFKGGGQRPGVQQRSHGRPGVVMLQGAAVGGQVSFEMAELRGDGMCALTAEGIKVGADLFLTRIQATGSHDVIRLMSADIKGSLVCDGGRVALATPDRGRAVDLRMITLGRTLSLRPDFLVGDGALIALDGLTYPVVPRGEMSTEQWVAFLRNRMEYAAQPYRQLADVHNAAGMERDARRFLIAQQDDLLHSGKRLSAPERLRLHLLRVGLGYGYQTWRALIGLGLTILLAMVLTVGAARTTDAVGVPPNPANPTTHMTMSGEYRECSLIDQLGLGLELAIPLLSTATKMRCDFVSARDTGEQLVVGAGRILQLLGWAFATLFVSGYTTLVRKT